MPPAVTVVNREVHDTDLFTASGPKSGNARISRDVIGQMMEVFASEEKWCLLINMTMSKCW